MRRLMKPVLAASLLAFAASGFAATTSKSVSVSPTERAQIESVVHDYLLANPEILVQAMQNMQQKQYQEAEKAVKQTQADAHNFAKQLFQQAGDPVVGNPNGTVTVTEFFDYQCPHCVDMASVMTDIIKSNPNLRIVYKEFPIRGPMSEVAARAALAANMQGKYQEMSHSLLTANQQLTPELIYQIAGKNGINVDKLKKDMDSKAVVDQLKANMKLAQELKLFGTPALFIGKTNAAGANSVTYFPGQMTVAQLQDAINKANQ